MTVKFVSTTVPQNYTPVINRFAPITENQVTIITPLEAPQMPEVGRVKSIIQQGCWIMYILRYGYHKLATVTHKKRNEKAFS